MKDDHEKYAVGYGKPPRETRFVPGQSGNPLGRPIGSCNTTTLLESALNERVTINENRRRKKISKRQALVKQLVNKAVSGDHRSLHVTLALARNLDERLELSQAKTAEEEEWWNREDAMNILRERLSFEERAECLELMRKLSELEEKVYGPQSVSTSQDSPTGRRDRESKHEE